MLDWREVRTVLPCCYRVEASVQARAGGGAERRAGPSPVVPAEAWSMPVPGLSRSYYVSLFPEERILQSKESHLLQQRAAVFISSLLHTEMILSCSLTVSPGKGSPFC